MKYLTSAMTALAIVSLLSACGGGGGNGVVIGAGGAGGSSPSLSIETIQKVDAAVAAEMKNENLPGMVVGVWMPDGGTYLTAVGSSNLATGRPRQLGDPFRIASISKTFIGTAILQLADQGRLSVNDKLSKWYPDFPNADLITVNDLLRMRSGIPDSANEAFLKSYYESPLAIITPDEMIARSAARTTEFMPPDTVTKYVNTNFMILERIIEKVTQSPISAVLDSMIFTPLGMRDTLYPTSSIVPGELHGYSFDSATGQFDDKTVLNPLPAGGAGAIISSLRDLRIYGKALCAGTLLKPATQAQRLDTNAFTGGSELVRYGQAIGTVGRFCGHNGTIFGFSTELWYLPEKDALMVINVNRLDLDDASKSNPLFLKLSKLLFPDLVQW